MPRPINADVPAETPQAEAAKRSAPRSKPQQRRRKPVPAALKMVAGLFLLAVVFIVAAILGGDGANQSDRPDTPAPVSEAPSMPAGAPAAETAEELGYPAFATANTTRVGGGDPASNAAAVALAVYPSTKPSQRPPAVALVDAGDWQGAIAASVLMATPLGAPSLLSESDGLPNPTETALEALDPQGSKATKGFGVFAIGSVDVPSGSRAKRVGARASGGATASGAAARATAIAALREELAGRPPRHLVIASATRPELAMPAAGWAARSGDPILFSDADELPAETAKVLEEHPKVPVYVLGPSSAISSRVVREAEEVGGPVRRVSGEDPVTNAIAFARYADGGFGWNVNDPGHGFVVARSDEPLNAAAASALSASGAWGPLLLSDSADTLPAALRGYLLDVKPGYTTDPTRAFYNHVWVIGDQAAISVNEQAEIDELAALAKIGGGE